MKRFGVHRYQLNNVRQNWEQLKANTRVLASNELDHLVFLANRSLLLLNRWMKERDEKVKRKANPGPGPQPH